MKLPLPVIKAAVIVLSLVALFLAGRFSAPKHVDNHQHIIDSLVADRAEAIRQRDLAINNMHMEQKQSQEHIQKSIADQAEKIYYKAKYEKELARNHSYTPSQLDSAILAGYSRYPRLD